MLVVDDDAAVREISACMLEELGYTVLQAESGPDALARIEDAPHLDILVTDIRMPGMSGLELSDIATRRRRDLGVVLVSGYFLPQPLSRRFVQKPFRTHELDAAIRAELSHRPHA